MRMVQIEEGLFVNANVIRKVMKKENGYELYLEGSAHGIGVSDDVAAAVTRTDRAALLYETYCKAVGGKAHDGKPLPNWQEFRADPARKVQADAWEAIAGV